MAQRCLPISIAISCVCFALANNSEYVSTTERSKGPVTEDRFSPNILRSRNASKLIHVNDNENGTKDRKSDKKWRTITDRSPHADSRDNCCGSRYDSSAVSRPDPYYNRIPPESDRYPSQYGDRLATDRYGWQSQNRPSSSNNGRPIGGESYSGSYGGSGFYPGSQAGERFGQRPGYGSESTSKPSGSLYGSSGVGGYGYGDVRYGYSPGRPGGYGGPIGNDYGISGTLADGDEFGPGQPGLPDVAGSPQHPGNIQTQKAIALKALAGVALIGAAAALATNPVLLPLGILTGRRKRSSDVSQEDPQTDYILTMLKNNFPKVYNKRVSDRLNFSPKCIARLSCEIQKDYLDDLRENERKDPNTARQLPNLIQNSIFSIQSIPVNIKALLEVAISVGSSEESCHVFPCSFMGNT